MPLSHLEHLLIRTADLEGTRDWYVRVLGLRDGPHPDFKFPVCWLYIGDTDVIHLTQGGESTIGNRDRYLGPPSQAARGSGVVDHIAFRSTGIAGMLARLTRDGIVFSTRQVDEQGLFQLFFHDPNGLKIELNFDSAEARDVIPELMASALP